MIQPSRDHEHPASSAPGSALELLGIHAPAWHADALCAQADPEAWFPEKGGSTREAKAICGRCPVAAECVDDALTREERFGVWGGLSERERRKILQRMGVPATHNARKTRCVNGHEFDDANTYWRPGGGRECRRCQADAVARYKDRQEQEEQPA